MEQKHQTAAHVAIELVHAFSDDDDDNNASSSSCSSSLITDSLTSRPGHGDTAALFQESILGDWLQPNLNYLFESHRMTGSVSPIDICTDMGSDSIHSQTRGASTDTIRVSMSSFLSSSSQGSGQDDADCMGDLYMWGEGIGDGILGGGIYRVSQAAGSKTDALFPKAMDASVVLDVFQVACGNRHAALITKQGEVFCWGEEAGGRLGHGVDVDVSQPQLVEALANTTVELLACGEYHSCAVTVTGELYTWGDGTHKVGLLGHGNDMSHWMPKRVEGPLQGLRVSSVSCGLWHTAVVTSTGKLFTFGDGTFGVLGHGNKASTATPKEVDSLKGLRTLKVSCGVWHTAAVVEVMIGSASVSCAAKLFTWGDGDKGRLGHGNKEQKLIPTCVTSLVDYNFCRVACGHSLTVALTVSGQVFTMGSTVYGQLGDPHADGMIPKCVEGRLRDAFVEDVAAGAFHVAVLTTKGEVFTWGKGANGRLGHGDHEDRKVPTLVEALKDKQVKTIACGSSITAAVCVHKWVSGSDQSLCSGCRQPFGFTRKRHNCYNCGLVFCHYCSSKKTLRASMAPNPHKPYRVCDPCYIKLRKAAESAVPGARQFPHDNRQETPVGFRPQPSSSKLTAFEQFKLNESKIYLKRSRRSESSSSSKVSPVRNGLSHYPAFGPSRKLISASVPQSRISSRATSPIPSRRSSPPRATTPPPMQKGFISPKVIEESTKKINESLTKEIVKLKTQVDNLTRHCQLQDAELKHLAKQLQEAVRIAGEESAKCKAAKDVIKSLTAQLKGMTELLPGENHNHYGRHAATSFQSGLPSALQILSRPHAIDSEVNGTYQKDRPPVLANADSHFASHGENHQPNGRGMATSNGLSQISMDNLSRMESQAQTENPFEPGLEWVEQDEQGVYITLVSLPNGGRDLKRVRFSRRYFSEGQAELWWQQNKVRVHEQYNVRDVDRPIAAVSKLSSLGGGGS